MGLIHILYDFVHGPWGGGNQFLLALKKEYIRIGVYVDSPHDADIILFNSHHNIKNVFRARMQNTKAVFLHRVDGPIQLIRDYDKYTDKFIFRSNSLLANGTIFQSKWSQSMTAKLGYPFGLNNVIINSPDEDIFKRAVSCQNVQGGKIRNNWSNVKNKVNLICSSWSTNKRKGFDTYSWLDLHLDFSQYNLTFVGRSPIKFKNICMVPAVRTRELCNILKAHDIFITASINDPCSNSLIEALSAGLPAIVKNSGGHPEIIQGGGLVFGTNQELINCIEMVASDYPAFVREIPDFSIRKTAQEYISFAQSLQRNKQAIKDPKKIWLRYMGIKGAYNFSKILKNITQNPLQ